MLCIGNAATDCFGDFITERLLLSYYYLIVNKEIRRPYMAAINITKDNFEREVLNSTKPVLVDFWAPWCGPCRMVSPVVDEIAEERNDIKVCKVNVDDESSLASEYGVMSIPTLVVFKEGKVVKQSIGAKPKNQILAMI